MARQMEVTPTQIPIIGAATTRYLYRAIIDAALSCSAYTRSIGRDGSTAHQMEPTPSSSVGESGCARHVENAGADGHHRRGNEGVTREPRATEPGPVRQPRGMVLRLRTLHRLRRRNRGRSGEEY
jgi:hypothetical protein